MAHCRFLHGTPGQVGFAPPDFLLRLVALMNFMRLSLRERRTRKRVQRSVAGNPGRDDKKERAVEREGPLPWDRAAVAAAGTPFPSTTALSIDSTFLCECKKITGSWDVAVHNSERRWEGAV
jgi:hypothetical protein